MQALCTLQPYAKKKLNKQDVLSFPWDNMHTTDNISQEQRQQRFQMALEKRGLKRPQTTNNK